MSSCVLNAQPLAWALEIQTVRNTGPITSTLSASFAALFRCGSVTEIHTTVTHVIGWLAEIRQLNVVWKVGKSARLISINTLQTVLSTPWAARSVDLMRLLTKNSDSQ